MKHLILDTNIHLHFVDFEQVDWVDIFNSDVSIVIPPKVQREIDKVKDQSNNSKKKKKAKQISSKIAAYLLEDKQGKYPVRTCNDPQSYRFDEDVFNINVDDNWILLSAIRMREEESIDVIVVSADTNILVKAKNLGLEYFKMPEKYRLKEELTDEEKEIKNLTIELQKYKNRQSKPDLVFDNYEKIKKIPLVPVLDVEELVLKDIEKEKLSYPYRKVVDPYNDPSDMLRNSPTFLLHQFNVEDAQKYNTDLDEYFKEYEKFIRFKYNYDSISNKMSSLRFKLINKGTMPTGNLHIAIDFPPTIKLYNKHNIKTKPLDIPIKPSHISSGYMKRDRTIEKALASMGKYQMGINGMYDARPLFPYWDLTTKAKNKYHIEKSSLQHLLEISITLDDIFLDLTDLKSFEIQYKILDSNLIEGISGILNVIIDG